MSFQKTPPRNVYVNYGSGGRIRASERRRLGAKFVAVLVIAMLMFGGFRYKHASAPVVDYCRSNALKQLILVSISKRHLWACNGATTAYDSAVITGMESLPADLTPTGTYHIYGKQTALYLNGSDGTGSWHDHVYYWMPWLSNRYGVYGFHDATWRKSRAFGNVSPYSSNASHGCVETPLATAKWLYNWASIGTT